MIDLSVIIISYNTKDTTKKCLAELIKTLQKSPTLTSEIIVVDNASTDESVEEVKSLKSKIKSQNITLKMIESKENLGFGRGNNYGLKYAEGEYVLFLNSDAFVREIDFDKLLGYLNIHPDIGALTVKLELPNGQIDMASHRGFPTIWRTFTYFAKLERFLGKLPIFSSLFSGYHLLHLNLNTIHEVDAISGAFFLTRKKILDTVGGFDTRFFMYGEDLDLCWQIKNLGYKIIYYPRFTALHLKYQSGLKKKRKTTQSKTKQYFFDSMRIFYNKHYAPKNSWFVNQLVYFFINLKQRFFA